MAVKIDLTGHIYGDLTVIKLAVDEVGKKKKWLCKCKCGNTCIVSGSNLRNGHTKHCSECGYKITSEKKLLHGETGTKLYFVWRGILNRCENKKFKSYSDYGARGIEVCKEWNDSKTFFEWASVSGYKEGLEIDRIDVNGNYCPENCRWVSREKNANNKRNNKIIECNGETRTLAEWARHFGVNYKNLSRNLRKGYSLEEAVYREKRGDRTHMGSKNWRKNQEAAQPKEPALFGEEE